jgi:signal transduction histidine kinase
MPPPAACGFDVWPGEVFGYKTPATGYSECARAVGVWVYAVDFFPGNIGGAGRVGPMEAGMATVVNLNRARKQRRRAEAERLAADNRSLFGRSKDERQKTERERQRIARELDGKRLD